MIGDFSGNVQFNWIVNAIFSAFGVRLASYEAIDETKTARRVRWTGVVRQSALSTDPRRRRLGRFGNEADQPSPKGDRPEHSEGNAQFINYYY